MLKGIIFALGACLIWGFIFVVPQFMTGFSSIEVTLGRYTVYGILSSLIFFKSKLRGTCKYPRSIWMKAFSLSIVSTIIYFTCLVLALRFSTPAICALILGIAPIVIAFWGNLKQKEISFKSLIAPSILIFIGLFVINFPHLMENSSRTSHIWGLVFGFFALVAWSWYAVTNSRFLKKHPEVQTGDWTTIMGVATLFWVFIFAILFGVFFQSQIDIQKYLTLNEDLVRFIIGSSFLGLICSWIGAFLWNRACCYLPISLAGQITIFETIFGILIIYAIEQELPPTMESVGIALFLVAITYCIRQFAKRQAAAYSEVE